jgi:hypothetical protein
MADLRKIQRTYQLMGLGTLPEKAENMALRQAGLILPGNSEIGSRSTPENSIKYAQRMMYTDPCLRAAILDIRHMDKADGRVKKIHRKIARTAVKGGLKLKITPDNTRISKLWMEFAKRLGLNRHEKLESDARGLAMEGNLPMQWVVDTDRNVVAGVRMPTETIRPVVDINGVFKSAEVAYEQLDMGSGKVLAQFPLWRMTMVRLDPDNHDDMGSMGRPYLDASRSTWQKLMMTEEDLVIRRRERAPLRTAHTLEGATEADLTLYKQQVEQDQQSGSTNYYLNKKGAVVAVQGDTNLDQIADVVHLLDTFFAGSPAPKALFGYSDGMNRDILEDLKKDYYEEIDALQDTLSFVYFLGFRLQLLLLGINPDAYDFDVVFIERRTDTPNQRADLALKYQAIGTGNRIAWETAGLDPLAVLAARQAEMDSDDPYPTLPEQSGAAPNVNITPNNAPKGQSATSITNN